MLSCLLGATDTGDELVSFSSLRDENDLNLKEVVLSFLECEERKEE